MPPYLYSLFWESSQTGTPILRPLVYEFQDDPATHTIDDQAMLGPFVMAAPVLTEGASTRPVVFPAGRWFDALSGAVIEGPATVERELRLADLPLFVREGAILPWVDVAQSTADAKHQLYSKSQY